MKTSCSKKVKNKKSKKKCECEEETVEDLELHAQGLA
jgi:hypothetical protein